MTVATAVQFMTATSLIVMFTDCGGTMIPVGNNSNRLTTHLDKNIVAY